MAVNPFFPSLYLQILLRKFKTLFFSISNDPRLIRLFATEPSRFSVRWEVNGLCFLPIDDVEYALARLADCEAREDGLESFDWENASDRRIQILNKVR
jgi:hypothetical protein